MSTTDLQGLTEKEKEKRSHAVIIPQDFCAVLLDIAFQRLLIKDGGDGLAENETWAQEFSSASDFSQFRSRLVQHLTICLSLQPYLKFWRFLCICFLPVHHFLSSFQD
jgi:exportin-5